MTSKLKSGIEAAGCRVLQHRGSSSLVVNCPNKDSLAALRKLPDAERVEVYQPQIRLSSTFLTGLNLTADESSVAEAARTLAERGDEEPRVEPALPGLVSVDFFDERSRDIAFRALRRYGLRDIHGGGKRRLLVNLAGTNQPLEALEQIARRQGVKRIEDKKIKRLLNDVARNVIANGVLPGNPGGPALTGAGETIGVADSGLDTGDSITIHADFAERIESLQSFPITDALSGLVTNPGGDDGSSDDFSGHGTHVAGSVLGDGSRSEILGIPAIRGVAPEARLVFQAIEQRPHWTIEAVLYFLSQGRQPPASGLFGIPDDLEELFQAAFDSGARIHNNSWGGGDPGVYDGQSEDVDRFMWEHRDFLVVVAAGNSGSDTAPANGEIDLISVDSPGTAKNCLTVGACENDRGSEFSTTYGDWWASDFPNAPFDSDVMADSIDHIVAFSSRGPCTTGRRKPDVIAPGTYILSTRSSRIPANNFAWHSYPPAKHDYMFMGGTSMAAPLVSGAAALVRQFLRRERAIANPSAAILKAAIIHSAAYLDYPFARSDSARWADYEQGWGRVSIRNVLAPDAGVNVLFFDEDRALHTGDLESIGIDVQHSSAPLRATLVYTDFPDENLVNNLNLIATAPDGSFHLGNDFDSTAAPNSLNNVEGVVVDAPQVGNWEISVVASEVAEGPQTFALVVSGGGVGVL